MRVVLATEFTAPRQGGIERQVEALADALRAAGHEATVLTSHPGPARAGVRRLSLVRLGPIAADPRAPALVRAALRELDPHVVHGHASTLTPFPWIAAREARAMGIPGIVSLHSLPGPGAHLWRQLDRLGVTDGVHLAAVSQRVADEAQPLARGRPVHVLPDGIDPGPDPVERGPTLDPRVVGLLRLTARKRPEAFVRVLAEVARRRGRPLPADIAGDGPLRAALEQPARDAGISLHGWLPHEAVRPLLDRADLCLHPTVREAFGLAPLEACAAGLPVVCRSGSGPADVLGKAAIAAESDAELADAVLTLAADPARRSAMGAVGRSVALAHSWERVLPQILALYASP